MLLYKNRYQILQTDVSELKQHSLFIVFPGISICCERDRLALIKRHTVNPAQWLQQLQSEVNVQISLSLFVTRRYMCELHPASFALPLHYLHFRLSLMCMTQVQLLHLGQVLHVTSLPQMWLSSGQNLIYYSILCIITNLVIMIPYLSWSD